MPTNNSWNSQDPAQVAKGGTGAATLTGVLTGNGTSAVTASTVTQHGVIVGGASNAVASTGVGSTGQVLQANSAADPTYSTATFPSTATGTGKVLRADGTNWAATTATFPDTAGTSGNILTSNGTNWSSAAPATSGTVTSVSGTANQVAVANGTTTPVISLVGPYTPATYTAHGVLIGEGTSSIAALAAGSSGQVLQSGGASADPAYSTATYPATTTVSQLLYSSATNVVSGLATANRAVITTNSTGVPVATALATDGQVIIGSTAGAPAAATLSAGTNISITNASNSITIATTGIVASAFDQISTQTFTGNGTYTPTTGMKYCIVELVGGGGGGGGAAGSSTNLGAAGGGGSGGYARKTFSAATIGGSQTVTVGAAGTAGSAGNNPGGTGGTTSLGALLSATGGVGGGGSASASSIPRIDGLGGAGGTGSSGDLNITGDAGEAGNIGAVASVGVNMVAGCGAGSYYGGKPKSVFGSGLTTGVTAGNPGLAYGAGGGGAAVYATNTNTAGGAGVAGVVYVTEYLSV